MMVSVDPNYRPVEVQLPAYPEEASAEGESGLTQVQALPLVKEVLKPAVKLAPKVAEAPKWSTMKAVDVTDKALNLNFTFISLMRHVAKAVSEFFQQSLQVERIMKTLGPVLQGMHLLSVILVPFHLFHLVEGIYQFIKGDIEVGDLVLNTLEMLGELVDGIVTFLSGLAEIGAIAVDILKYLWPFDLIGIGLAIISLVSNGRGWHQSAKFAKELQELLAVNGKGKKVPIKNYADIVSFINSKKVAELGKALNADGEDIQKRVNHLFQKVKGAASKEECSAAKKELKTAIRTLHGRVSSKITAHKLAISSSSISLVANTVLFMTPFVLPVCPAFAIVSPIMYSLRGVSAGLSISNAIYKIVEDHKFSESHLMKMQLE